VITPSTLRQLAHRRGQLIYLGLSPDVRLCSRGRVNADGQTWESAGFTVDAEFGQHGMEAITILLDDIDYAWAWRMREFRPGVVCQWSLMYAAGNEWVCEQLFSGVIEAPRTTPRNQVQIKARVATGDTAWAPRVPFESPHSLPRGSEILINGTTYRVDG
jgi:hypothetical protein